MLLPNRLMKVVFTFPGDKTTVEYNEKFSMSFSSKKNVSSAQNAATISIFNIARTERQYLMDRFSMFQVRTLQTPFVGVTVQIGRQNSDMQTIYNGDIVSINCSNLPDMAVTIQCATNQIDRTLFQANTPREEMTVADLSAWVAQQMGKQLDIDLGTDPAANKKVVCFKPKATMSSMPYLLMQTNPSRLLVWVDDFKLYVRTLGTIGKNKKVIPVNKATGMVGKPDWTEWGVRATVFADMGIKLADIVSIKSDIDTSIDGAAMFVTSIEYNVTSRDNAFYATIYTSPAASHS